jgi:hypothetical protein
MDIRIVKSKTFWTGIAAVIAAVGGVFTGTMETDTAIQTGIGGLVAIFLRDSIEKIR